MTDVIVETALAFKKHGIIPWPVWEDGSKRPKGEWKQAVMPTEDEIVQRFGGRAGLGLLTGSKSGGVELFEFEGRAVEEGLWDQFESKVNGTSAQLAKQWEKVKAGYLDESPSGGKRVVWRVSDGKPAGNTPLARRAARDDELTERERAKGRGGIRVLIETRGEGGFAVVPPSSGTVHKTGKPYVQLAGGPPSIQNIPLSVRKKLVSIASSFNTYNAPRLKGFGRPTPAEEEWEGATEWTELLDKFGWEVERVREDDGVMYVRHPGIERVGHSATIQPGPAGKMYMFSTSTEFEADRWYSKVEFTAVLGSGGDTDQTRLALGLIISKPTIWVDNRNEAELADEVVTRILTAQKANPKIFSQGTEVCEIGLVGEVRGRVLEVSQHTLAYHASHLVDFKKTSGSGENEREVYVSAPREIMSGILEGSRLAGLPPLKGATTVPFFTPSGGLWTLEGYNAESKMYYTPTIVPAGWKPDLTLENVNKAKGILALILWDFPFDSEADKAVAYSLMLSPFVRAMIDGPLPLHGVEAPLNATGKSLLTKACLYPALGHVAPQPCPKMGDEMAKVVLSNLLAGARAVVFDNVDDPVTAGELSAVLTAYPNYESRVLGETRIISLPNDVLWSINGNNPQYGQDQTRRLVRSRINSGSTNPGEGRNFRVETETGLRLEEWLAQYRPQIVAACLTVVSAWVQAGQPKAEKPEEILASFEAWSGIMGGICGFLGLPSPVGDREKIRQDNDMDLVWHHFVKMWLLEINKLGGEKYAEAAPLDLVRIIERGNLAILLGGRDDTGRAMSLGRQLTKKRDIPLADHFIDKVNGPSGVTYKLRKAGGGYVEAPSVPGSLQETDHSNYLEE